MRNTPENVSNLLLIRWPAEFKATTAWYTRRDLPLLRSALDAETYGLCRRQWMVECLQSKIAELEADR